jgi:hypothetical protein
MEQWAGRLHGAIAFARWKCAFSPPHALALRAQPRCARPVHFAPAHPSASPCAHACKCKHTRAPCCRWRSARPLSGPAFGESCPSLGRPGRCAWSTTACCGGYMAAATSPLRRQAMLRQPRSKLRRHRQQGGSQLGGQRGRGQVQLGGWGAGGRGGAGQGGRAQGRLLVQGRPGYKCRKGGLGLSLSRTS